MLLIYHILTTVLLVLLLPALPIICLVSEKWRGNLFQRLGLFTGIPPKKSGEYRIWVHALSVGEVNSALPFVMGLKKERPDVKILFTASTRTGFNTACSLMSPDKQGSPIDALGYFPFDVWISVLAVSCRIRPDLVCLVETDLWPGFLSFMKHRKIPVVLVNARLSPRSLAGYKRLGRWSGLFFSGLSHVMTQTPKDAAGFETLGIGRERLSVTGNMKFDSPGKEIGDDDRLVLERKFGLGTGQKLWIAGSTHPGEESMVIEAFTRIRKKSPELKLVIAPRDPKRTRKLLGQLPLAPYASACLSDPESEKIRADLLFIDTLGELAMAYAVCDFAFVGGSLVKQGGHNPLEPAMFGKPVFFGPHMADFREIEGLLMEAGGGRRVKNSGDMEVIVVALLAEPDRCKSMGEASQKVFYSNTGALKRIVEKLVGDFLV